MRTTSGVITPWSAPEAGVRVIAEFPGTGNKGNAIPEACTQQQWSSFINNNGCRNCH
ncbi:MAG: hypothetical protein J2P48_10380 [Alphaproteobacteria bacterium]|nr:hypothetical protein [Alphaproteobacteria bacterium]